MARDPTRPDRKADVMEMDEAMWRAIRERAHALWETDGSPKASQLDYWLRAERELLASSAAAEEDFRAAGGGAAPEREPEAAAAA
jgi:Protein of unknown function (DUF2934)